MFEFKIIKKTNNLLLIQVKSKKEILFFLLFFLIYSSFSQTVQTGIQYTCEYYQSNCAQPDIPVRTRTHYTYSQQIVSIERIIEGGWSSNMEYITRLRYYINNPNHLGLINSDDWSIYFGLTNKNHFDSISDWIPITQMALVLDSIVPQPNDCGWMDIHLQTPFYYNGADNLIIAVHDKSHNNSPIETFFSSFIDTVSAGLVKQVFNCCSPNPASPPPGSLSTFVPILQLYFEESCASPTNFSIDSLYGSGAFFSWIPIGTETMWKLRYRKTDTDVWNIVDSLVQPLYHLSNLFSIQAYIVQIQAVCGNETSEWVNPIHFTTPMIPEMEYSVDWLFFNSIISGDFGIMDSLQPNLIVKLDSINTPDHNTSMDRFFSRIKGYIIPRVTGNYTFHFACNDIGEFWLSTDDNESNGILAILVDSINSDYSTNQYFQYLVEGEKYFFMINHYDTIHTDFIRLGWVMPGDSVIKTINRPYLTSCGSNIVSQSIKVINNKVNGYAGHTNSLQFQTIPWNVSDKRIIWTSTDENIATVSSEGQITLLSPGICEIIGTMLDNQNANDTVFVNVWDYYGPFYVKSNALNTGSGISWDDPIDLQTLLEVLNKRLSNDTIIILVSEGIYKPTETLGRNISFVLKNCELYGGYSNSSIATDTTMRNIDLYKTIFDGNLGDSALVIDNTFNVVKTSDYVVIDGISVQNGCANRFMLGTNYESTQDWGGGIYISEGSTVKINNCVIMNNYAYFAGGGIYSRNSTGLIQNTKIHKNHVKQPPTPIGDWFTLVFGATGGGINIHNSFFLIENCEIFENESTGNGSAIRSTASNTTIINSSIYDNTHVNSQSSTPTIHSMGSDVLSIKNSSIDGCVYLFYGIGWSDDDSKAVIENSTLTCLIGQLENVNKNLFIDNSIIIGYGFNSDTSRISVSKSILGNVLYGQNLLDSQYVNLPIYDLWLDTLANNGGNTPTMKLKNVPFNPAKSNGNPFYLGTHDQRGALRQDSVSIGAYQWVNPTEIIGSQSVLELCIGDSFELYAEVLPEFVSVGDYYLTSSDSSIVSINGKIISALQEGFTTIIYNTSNGQKTDTCYLEVIGNLGTGTILGDVSVCQGQNSATYIVPTINNATSYIWTLPSGANGTSTTNSIDVDFTTSAISGYITVKGINNCGEGDVSTLAITVNPLPVAAETISGDAIVCLGQNSVIYTVPTIANATSYIWTLPNGATGSSITNSIDVNFGTTAISGNITVKGTNNCGEGDVSILVISEDPLPLTAGTITGDVIVCQGENSVTYSVPTIEHAIYYDWTLPNGATGTSSTNSIDVDFGITAISGNITVKGRNQCGDGTVSTLSIVVNPLPASAETISGISIVCQEQNSISYSVQPIENAISYIWTLPNGFIGSSTTNTINVSYSTIANSGNISVKGINECGVGTTSTKMITVNPLPNAGETIIGPASVCQGQNSVVYYVPTIANADSYVWTLPDGATGTSTTNSITVDYSPNASSGNITVKGINECGEGLVSTLPVILNLIPDSAGTISGISSVCQGQNSVTYTVPSIENALNYYWTLPNGATGSSLTNSIIVNFGTSAVSGNITVVGVNYCGNGPVSSKIISVNPLPSSPEPIVGFETVCQGQNSVNYSIPLIPNALSYIWSLPTGMTGTSSTNNININFGISSSSGNISVKGTNACGIGTTATKTITVNSLPGTPSTISGANTVCVGENSINYNVTEILNATSYTWTLPNGASGTSTTNSITVNYGTTATSGNITVKGNNSCGNGSIGTKAITVNTIPNAAGIISGPTSVCQGETGVIYSTSSIVNANSYIWNYPYGATGISTSNSITLNYGNSAVSGNITVKGLNLCGEGSVTILPVNINPIPETPTILLNNNILSSDASTGNQWYNQNGIIEGASNQYFEITENGTYYVIVNQNDCPSNPSNSILVNNVLVQNFDKNLIIISPNPFTNLLSIKNQSSESYQYCMYNGVGQVLFSGTLETEVHLNTSDLATGLYIIKFVNDIEQVYYKVIKQ